MLHASDEQVALFDELAAAVPPHPDADFMPMLNASSVSWIFPFMKALDNACETCQGGWDRAILGLGLYIRIEEFLLEDLRFLTYFPESRHALIRSRAEQKLRRAQVRREALRMLRSGLAEAFTTDLAEKVETPGILLYQPEEKADLTTALLLHDPEALTVGITNYLRLIRYFVEQETGLCPPEYWIETCEALIARECEAMDETLLTGLITPEVRQRTEGLVRTAGALFLLCKAADREIDMVRRLMFYRYLCVLDERHLPPLKNLMLSTFLKHNCRPPEYTWEELIGFSLPSFVGKIAYFTENIPEDRRPYTLEGKGLFTLAERRITLAPFDNPLAGRRMHKLLTLWDGSLRINSFQKPTADLSAVAADNELPAKIWADAAADFKRKKTVFERHETKELPPVNALLKIRITALHPAYPSLAFATVEDDMYEGNGAIHLSQVTRIKQLTSLSGIFAVGDLVTARVIEVSENKRLRFSILDEISKSIATRFHPGEYTYARLISKNENSYRWISEKGYPLYTVPSPLDEVEPELDDLYMLRLTHVNRTGYVRAEIEEMAPEDMEIDPQKAIADLVGYYVDERLADYTEEGVADELHESHAEAPGRLSPDYVRQLIYLIDLYTESTDDHVLRFNLCQTARLLADMIEEANIVAYYDRRILYLTELHHFINRQAVTVSVIDAEAIQRFPRLAHARTVLSLLALDKDDPAAIDTLRQGMQSERKLTADLARLLLIRLLAGQTYPDLYAEADAEVRSLLAVEEEEDPDGEAEEIDFGRETNTREFKSTIVFPPNSNGMADIDRQMERILWVICGFLNAEGGVLFIGVNDIGYPKGIEPDLSYLHANVDKYQLIIRNYIVKELGKDINGLIRFDFHAFSGKTVCAISVPAYHEVVFFRDVVWQRQGNSTRPLDLPDIRLLKERRKNLRPALRITTPAFGEAKEEAEREVEKVFPVSIPTYTPTAVAKPRPTAKPERPASLADDEPDRIATSALAPRREQEPTAYFSILRSGRFVITHEEPHRSDARLTLPIYDDDSDGYLIYVYENGYANRVAVSTLLSKKPDYEYANAMFGQSSLLFVALARPDDTLYLKVSSKSGEYLRTLSLKTIKLNTDLSLRGTALYTVPFGRIVQIDLLNKEQAREVENIRSETPTTLGIPAQSFSVIRTAMYLSELLNGER